MRKFHAVFEVPTNSVQEFEYYRGVAAEFQDFAFALCLNGEEFSHKGDFHTGNMIAKFHKVVITEPCVSMTELRKVANKTADEFNCDHRIFSDGNFFFAPGWDDYIKSTIRGSVEFEQEAGAACFVGMEGAFGSTSSKDRIVIPMNPMMDTDRGILYRASAFDYQKLISLPGGFEDYLFTSSMLRGYGIIPLKRFMSKIRHPRKRTHLYTDAIHDRNIWRAYNLRPVRELWGDPNWIIPESLTKTNRKEAVNEQEYISPQPKISFLVMKGIRERFIGDPVLGKYVIARKGEGK